MIRAVIAFSVFLMCGSSAQAETLSEIFNATLQRSAVESAHLDKSKSLDATINVASSLTPAPPSLIGEYRHELLYGLKRSSVSPATVNTNGSGEITPASTSRETSVNGNEFRIGLSIPLWLPTQRSKSIDAARADKKAYLADYGSIKLALAGELRSMIAELRAAEIEVNIAENSLKESSALVDEVGKRVKVGELAKNDLNKVSADYKIAQADYLRAKQKFRKLMVLYEGLTGVSKLPVGNEKQAKSTQVESHPRLLKVKADFDAAAAKEGKAKVELMDTPELSVTYARFLNSLISPADEAVIVGFKLPLPSFSRYEAKTSEAKSERIKTAVLVQRELESILIAVKAAEREMADAQEEFLAMQSAVESANDVYSATRKAFELGEVDISALLKTVADKKRAILRFEAAKLYVETATASYNQNIGVLP